MSGVTDVLFGKKGTPAQVVDTTPSEYAGLRPDISTALKSIITSGGGPSYSASNPLAAPVTANEQSILDMLMSKSGTPSGTAAASADLTKTLQGQYLSPDSNPFLQATIDAAQRSVLDKFKNEVVPQLRTSFTNAGQFIQPGTSSPFERAAALASGGLANSLSDIATSVSYGNYEAERNRMAQAATAAPQVDAADVNRTISILQAQALPRLVQEMGIERGVAEFNTRVQTLLQALGLAAGASTGNAVSVPGTAGTGGLVGALAGGAGEGAGKALGTAAAAALLSDRRAKENIFPVGTMPKTGLPVYVFNYKGGVESIIGLMADEVEKVIPDAVVMRDDGMKMVDYGIVIAREAA